MTHSLGVLLLDPESESSLEGLLRASKDVDLYVAQQLADALSLLGKHRIHLALVSCDRPAGGDPAIIGEIHGRFPDLPLIAIADEADGKACAAAIEAGAQELLPRTAVGLELLPRLLAAVVDRCQMRARLEHMQDDLDRVSRDFQEFAHIVSHDLKAPLQIILYSAAILEQIHKQKSPIDPSEYLERTSRGARQMGQYLDDVLKYARVESRGGAIEPTPADAALAAALAQLQPQIDAAGAKITQEPLPTVPADAEQLREVFLKLIDNSLKFAAERAPEIHVSSTREADRLVFCVQDNGIGFDPAEARTIFTMFKRLNPDDAPAGTGAGLAIARRIVTRHRGEIWAESEPGRGSRFCFSLPAVSVQKSD